MAPITSDCAPSRFGGRHDAAGRAQQRWRPRPECDATASPAVAGTGSLTAHMPNTSEIDCVLGRVTVPVCIQASRAQPCYGCRLVGQRAVGAWVMRRGPGCFPGIGKTCKSPTEGIEILPTRQHEK